ncbi:chloroplastic group IIA intron splicing facilitator CRS1, chloroplastic [Panicum miliaceum]|uniref:Chloroplastic group IIA intron splicing facilitator CRS1, chloroplastic n=1 Tax=Panicum miliaceum TaxID=4540 RepID=A0A3L6RJ80_PANMI|nr:chloroplastic group IIA intron splicing facilitator CRS1, chloroplastic [Panicum miliaceum]
MAAWPLHADPQPLPRPRGTSAPCRGSSSQQAPPPQPQAGTGEKHRQQGGRKAPHRRRPRQPHPPRRPQHHPPRPLPRRPVPARNYDAAAAAAAAIPFHLPVEPREQVHEAAEKGKPRAVPWAAARDEGLKVALRREKKVREPTRAETELAAGELDRLRRVARGMGRWARAKKAGVTDEVVEDLRREWARGEELAAVRIVEPLRRNMDRAREILEIKTGGLVVWTKGDIHFVYRGSNYQQNTKHSHYFVSDVQNVKYNVPTTQVEYGSEGEVLTNTYRKADDAFQEKYQSICSQKDEEPVKGTLDEREVNRLLDSLGPRFVDWWWNTPLPVDADLLPELVPGFKTPFRQCPPGVRPTLADEELTYLRKLARRLPTHFALGRNRRLQGLAAAILKLWEKSLIAKIAVKVGIQNTNNEQRAWNLKAMQHLTGGTIILRNKDFIILYRGKDFLPGGVAQTVIQREAEVHDEQVKEEEARLKAVDSLQMVGGLSSEESSVGTFREYQDFQADHVYGNTEKSNTIIELEAEKHRLEKELKDQEWKLSILNKKIERSNQALAKLHSSWSPSEESADKELLTEEEKAMFRRIGRKMDGLVLLGRRGIFDGVIEEIHQHWKHKEVVKVITKQNQACQIMYTANLLEVETGGILIAVEKLPTSHSIILYRGKNYRRPEKSSSSNLLTKREALRRSIEVQRRGSMKYFARERQKSILELKRRLRYVARRIKYRTPRS